MNLKEINSLVELFFKKYEEKFPKGIKGMKSHEETFLVSLKNKDLPDTTSVSILTSGLLGEQYIGLQPGFLIDESDVLVDGDFIEDTKSALVLEDLIGQFLFSQGD